MQRTRAVGGVTAAAVLLLAAALSGCLQIGGAEINPFLTLTETFGGPTSSASGGGTGGGVGGGATQATFRRELSVTFANLHPAAGVQFSFVAFVLPSSLRSADQQDALFASGYTQLTREIKLGNAFTLTPGTFVLNGSGLAGATRVLLGPAGGTDQAGVVQPTTREFTIVTPDTLLFFQQPPTSCESVAFMFTREGEPITADFFPDPGPFFGSTSGGGLKTMAQVDAYQCQPFRPGLFLQVVGGASLPNQYLEGATVRVEFRPAPDANGNFAIVTTRGTQ